jgi:predicted nucleotidyltransferase
LQRCYDLNLMNARVSIDQDQIADFCRRWKVTELSLFGSVLRDDFRPESDIDVLVTFSSEAPWSLFDLVTMQGQLQQIFGREVHLVEEAGLRNPFRRRAILSHREVIFAA